VQPRHPYALKNRRRISHDEPGLEMDHPKAERLEPSIAPSVSASVIRTIDLDHEPADRGEKVDDVLAQHDLPSERDSQLAAGQVSPQASFGERGLGAHDTSAFVE
jgi:hypothetical protein